MWSLKGTKKAYERQFGRSILSLFSIFLLTLLPNIIQAAESVNYERPRLAFEDTAYDLSPSGFQNMSDADYDEASQNVDIWTTYDSTTNRINAIFFNGQFNSHTAKLQSMLMANLSFMYGSSYASMSNACIGSGLKFVRIKPCGYSTSEQNPNEIVLRNAPLDETIAISEDVHQCFTGGSKANRNLKGNANVGKRWAMMIEFDTNCGPEPGDGNGDGYDIGYCDGAAVTKSACNLAGLTWTRIYGGAQALFIRNKDNVSQVVGYGTTLSSDTANGAGVADAGRQGMIITSQTDPIMNDRNTFWSQTTPSAGVTSTDHRWIFTCGTGADCTTDSVMLSFNDIVSSHSLNNDESLQTLDNSYVNPTLMDQNSDGNYTDELWMLYVAGDAEDPATGPHANWNYLGEGCTTQEGQVGSPYYTNATYRLWNITGSPYDKTGSYNKPEYTCLTSGGGCAASLFFDYTELGYCHRNNKPTGDVCNVHNECNGINFCNETLCSTGYNCGGRGECDVPSAVLGATVIFMEECMSQKVTSGGNTCTRGNALAGYSVVFSDQCENGSLSPIIITGGLDSGSGPSTYCNGKSINQAATSSNECLSKNLDYGNNTCKLGYNYPGSGLHNLTHPDQCQTGTVAQFSFQDNYNGVNYTNVTLCDGHANGHFCNSSFSHGCRGLCDVGNQVCAQDNRSHGMSCNFNEQCSSNNCAGGGQNFGQCQ